MKRKNAADNPNWTACAIILVVAIVFLAVVFWTKHAQDEELASPSQRASWLETNATYEISFDGASNVDVIVRTGYTIGYRADWRLSAWVAYRLSASNVLDKVCPRAASTFAKDPDIANGFSTPQDYANSGYDRGHLAPAADMAWSTNAMRESFYMSNMSPQAPMFNRGIWRSVEQWVRGAAVSETNVFVVTGPIVDDSDLTNLIGRSNKIVVPSAFYKIVLDETPPMKMIAFVVPNKGSSLSPTNFCTTVDEVERLTNLDFFSTITNREWEAMEGSSDPSQWH